MYKPVTRMQQLVEQVLSKINPQTVSPGQKLIVKLKKVLFSASYSAFFCFLFSPLNVYAT